MEFIQLGLNPSSGIPSTDSYCFGKKTNRRSSGVSSGNYVYEFRKRKNSNGNNGGWDISRSNNMSFKLQLIF